MNKIDWNRSHRKMLIYHLLALNSVKTEIYEKLQLKCNTATSQ